MEDRFSRVVVFGTSGAIVWLIVMGLTAATPGVWALIPLGVAGLWFFPRWVREDWITFRGYIRWRLRREKLPDDIHVPLV